MNLLHLTKEEQVILIDHARWGKFILLGADLTQEINQVIQALLWVVQILGFLGRGVLGHARGITYRISIYRILYRGNAFHTLNSGFRIHITLSRRLRSWRISIDINLVKYISRHDCIENVCSSGLILGNYDAFLLSTLSWSASILETCTYFEEFIE